jgi:CRISPR/Cas system-associated protein endoribonuclease Cas2
MQFKGFILVVFSLTSFFVAAQECVLGVSEKSSEILIKVFQLNEEQVAKMEVWQAELQLKTKALEDEIQLLLDTHPQSSPQELTTLADKYQQLQQKIVNVSRETDVSLLSIFNEKQYERYIMLCDEARRRPIKVVPLALQGNAEIKD